MLTNDLPLTYEFLKNLRDYHYEKLYVPENPSGILLCQKHAASFRWKRRILQDDLLVASPLHKTDQALAEKLAVNLYRIVCIQYIQQQLNLIDNAIRSLNCGEPKTIEQNTILTARPFYRMFSGLHNYPRVPADFFDPHSPYRPLILAHLQKEYAWLIEWYLSDFTQNSEHPERLVFPVQLGFNVRSKSEVTIADRLYEEGILFHYEEKLTIGDHDSYPDFSIPVTYYEQYAWEHFGAMDNTYYYNRTRGKILDCLDHQRFPGINMITTYETKQHPLTVAQVNHQIRWLKERYMLALPDLPPDNSFNMYKLASTVQLQNPRR